MQILRSVKQIIDTAKIKVPAAARVNSSKNNPVFKLFDTPRISDDNLPTSSVKTSTLWQEGDKVEILLGYNGDNRQEFKGFVRRVSPSVPVLIECEGYAWQLRRKQFVGTWKSIQLVDFLKILTTGTDIILSPNIPSVPLINLCIKSGNALSALEYIKKNMHLAAYFVFDVLYVGLEETQPGATINTVNYRLGWNTVRDDKLKYRLADDTNVLVKVVSGKGKNAKRPIIVVGDAGGGIITENISNIESPEQMTIIANQLLLYAKYTGYEGSITGFLQPYCNPGDTGNIIDNLYKVRTGNYFVEGIEVKFGMNGGQRIVYISRALSVPNFVALVTQNISNGIAAAIPLV